LKAAGAAYIVLDPGSAPRVGVRMISQPAKPSDPAELSSRGSAAETPRRSADAKRVLVVDDNRDGAELLAEALRLDGHDVAVAYDAPGALSLVEERRFDVAILDLGLPLIDGYELARRIRERGSCLEMRLVAVTGYGQEGDMARTRAAGFDVHLVKPVDIDAVLAALNASAR
jgi:CheY-like chemotaxis protein